MPLATKQQQLLESLAQRIRHAERARGGERIRGTGIPALDQLLVGGGLPAGCLMEWLAPGQGTGVETLALWAAARARRPNELLLLVDSRGGFYPPAGTPLGWDSRTTVVIRGTGSRPAALRPADLRPPGFQSAGFQSAGFQSSSELRDLLWAVEQALRTPGVGVVVSWWERLSPQACRRLQLAAEKGGSLGVLLRPARVRSEPSFAEVRWGVQPLPSGEGGVRRWRVELCRARRQLAGGSVELELHHDEDRLHLVPAMASAARGGEPVPAFAADPIIADR